MAALSHTQIPNTPPSFPGKEDVIISSDYSVVPMSSDDEDYVWSTAVNIKNKIDQQIHDKTQGAMFFNAFPETRKRSADKDDGTDAAGDWTKAHITALQIYFVPVTDFTQVVPASFIPTEEDIKKDFGHTICDPAINKELIMDTELMMKKFPEPSQSSARMRTLLTKARKLMISRADLMPQPAAASTSKLAMYEESKLERYTDALLRSVLELLGVDDPTMTNIEIKEEESLITRMGRVNYVAKTEFQLLLRDSINFSSPVYAWGENKSLQLRSLKSFPDTVAQKVAECLAVASNNFKVSKSQEVFGIGVRHRFFSFWHAVFPASYLEKIHDSPSALTGADFVWVKMYPASEFGLDFCDPDQRVIIVRLLVGILTYIMKGTPLAGKY